MSGHGNLNSCYTAAITVQPTQSMLFEREREKKERTVSLNYEFKPKIVKIVHFIKQIQLTFLGRPLLFFFIKYENIAAS